jgi:hypothetical protein
LAIRGIPGFEGKPSRELKMQEFSQLFQKELTKNWVFKVMPNIHKVNFLESLRL